MSVAPGLSVIYAPGSVPSSKLPFIKPAHAEELVKVNETEIMITIVCNFLIIPPIRLPVWCRLKYNNLTLQIKGAVRISTVEIYLSQLFYIVSVLSPFVNKITHRCRTLFRIFSLPVRMKIGLQDCAGNLPFLLDLQTIWTDRKCRYFPFIQKILLEFSLIFCPFQTLVE